MAEYRSPLDGHPALTAGSDSETAKDPDAAGITVSDQPPGALFQVTVWSDDLSRDIAPLTHALSLNGSGSFHEAQKNGDTLAFRIAPDRILFRHPDHQVIEAALSHLSPQSSASLDLSHARAVLRLAGPRLPEFLPRLVTLPTALTAFPTNAFRQTAIGQVAVVIHRINETAIDIYIPTSYAFDLCSFVAGIARPFKAPAR